MTTRTLLISCAASVALAACGQFGHGEHRPDAKPRQASALLFSPNGEPLTSGPRDSLPCAEAMTQWLGRIDANHDGVVDRREFLDDARTQFERMDLDHDGFITADELSTFRAPYMDKTPALREPREARSDSDQDSPRRPRQDGAAPSSPGPRSLSSRQVNGADPVMSADTNLDFKVSRDEFLKQASDIFDHLEHDQNGGLGSAATTHLCPAAP